MGLGKTFSAAMIAHFWIKGEKYAAENRKALVMAPKATLMGWAKAFKEAGFKDDEIRVYTSSTTETEFHEWRLNPMIRAIIFTHNR